MKSWMTQLRKGKQGGREGWIEQNPEEVEEVERGSVGRLRGKEMLHNQLSRVFSCSPFFPVLSFLFLTDAIHICQAYRCASLAVFLFTSSYFCIHQS